MAREFHKLLGEDFQLGTSGGTKTGPTGGTLTGTKIGIHTFGVGGPDAGAVSQSWDPGSVPVGGKASTTIPYPGAVKGDFVLRSFSLDLQELQLTADVNQDDVVEVVLTNNTSSAVDLGSGTIKVLVLQSK